MIVLITITFVLSCFEDIFDSSVGEKDKCRIPYHQGFYIKENWADQIRAERTSFRNQKFTSSNLVIGVIFSNDPDGNDPTGNDGGVVIFADSLSGERTLSVAR
jgi:hypothetical protein